MVIHAVMPRDAGKCIIWMAHLSCLAAMNLVMGIGKVSSPATMPNLGNRNTMAQVPEHLLGDQ